MKRKETSVRSPLRTGEGDSAIFHDQIPGVIHASRAEMIICCYLPPRSPLQTEFRQSSKQIDCTHAGGSHELFPQLRSPLGHTDCRGRGRLTAKKVSPTFPLWTHSTVKWTAYSLIHATFLASRNWRVLEPIFDYRWRNLRNPKFPRTLTPTNPTLPPHLPHPLPHPLHPLPRRRLEPPGERYYCRSALIDGRSHEQIRNPETSYLIRFFIYFGSSCKQILPRPIVFPIENSDYTQSGSDYGGILRRKTHLTRDSFSIIEWGRN